ncbi:NmrA/HSCARG family protein [Nostoc sp.]|uniref:NmrA/HSCARG family protein n=1 Tax=Nostoc sp. TaxID=1180 RepID=UPI002FF4F45A
MAQQTKPEQIILVTGATGNQGGAIARHLLQRGKFKVRAMVRDQNKPAAQALQQAGAELVQGDFNDRASLDRAVQGVHGIFSMQDFREGAEVEIRHGQTLADAVKTAGIGHFVYSSVGSADRNTGIPHFNSKFQVEEHVRAIGLPYTILRPVFFFYNYNGMRSMVENGTLFQPLSPDTKLQQLSEEDYGAMVAEVFERPTDFINREIEVASVEMTMTEIAAAFSRVLGKNVAYQQIPFEAFEQQAGEEVTIMYRWFENVGYIADLARLKRDFPQPTDFESYLRVGAASLKENRGWAKSAESASDD